MNGCWMYRAGRGPAIVMATLLLGGCGWRGGLQEPPVGSALGSTDMGQPAADQAAASVDRGVDAAVPCDPNAPEVCNALDDDCDLRVDEGLDFVTTSLTVVREDEGRAGRCETCNLALHPRLLRHDDGLLALWQLASDGVEPNLWGRRFDLDGRPLGPPFPLDGDTVATGPLGLAAVAPGRTALSYCRDVGGVTGQPEFRWVDDDGAFISDALLLGNPGELRGTCDFAGDPSVVAAGGRALFGWSSGIQVWTRATDGTDGLDAAARQLFEDESGMATTVRLAVGHGRIALATERAVLTERRLGVYTLSLDGEVLSEVTIETPDNRGVFYFGLTATDDGWLVSFTPRGSGDPGGPVAYRIRIDREGRVLDGPTAADVGLTWFVRQELIPGPGGSVIFAAGGIDSGGVRLIIRRLDPEGREIGRWRAGPNEGTGVLGLDIVADGPDLWAIYDDFASDDGQPNRVSLLRLGCVED